MRVSVPPSANTALARGSFEALAYSGRPMATMIFLLTGAAFLASGLVAVSAELIWARRLAQLLGDTPLANATVVTVFLAGLGLGAWLAGRFADRLRFPLLVYALAAGLAAGFVLGSPWIFDAVAGLVGPLHDSLAGQPALLALGRVLLCGLMLLIPALLMGAALPLLCAAFRERQRFGRTVGVLYALHALGGASGAYLAGLRWLPDEGLRACAGRVGVIGLVAAAAAGLLGALLAHREGRRGRRRAAPAHSDRPGAGRQLRLAWAAAFVAGAVALGLQVAVGRLLAPMLGGTHYTATAVLVGALAGVAVGGGLGAALAVGAARRCQRALALAAGLLVMAGLGLALVVAAANSIPSWIVGWASAGDLDHEGFLGASARLAALLMLLPAVALGGVLPVLVAGLREIRDGAASLVGEIVLSNTLGAIAGALLVGLLGLPLLGLHGCLVALGAIATLSGGLLALSLGGRPRQLLMVAAPACLALLLAAPPLDRGAQTAGVFRQLLIRRAGPEPPGDRVLVMTRDSARATVTVQRSPDGLSLRVDGKVEASALLQDRRVGFLLGHLPLMLHPAAREVCLVGLGAGATLRAVAAHEVARIDCVEPRAGVIGAAQHFAGLQAGALDDPRLTLHPVAPRPFLAHGRGRYDVIIVRPPSPWTAGGGALFSAEHYAAAKARLGDGGVLCQWIPAHELDDDLLGGALGTLADAFEQVAVFLVGRNLICLASDRALTVTRAQLEAAFARPEVGATLRDVEITSPWTALALIVGQLPDDPGQLPSASWRETDDKLTLELRGARAMALGLAPDRRLFRPPSAQQLLRRVARLVPDEPRESLVRALARATMANLPRWVELAVQLSLVNDPRGDPQLGAELDEARRRKQQLAQAAREIGHIRRTLAGAAPRGVGGAAARRLDSLDLLRRLPGKVWRQKAIAEACVLRFDAARGAFERARAVHAEDYFALGGLALLDLRDGQRAKAEAGLARVRELAPGTRWLLALEVTFGALGEEAARSGLPSRAHKHFDNLLHSARFFAGEEQEPPRPELLQQGQRPGADDEERQAAPPEDDGPR